MNIPNFKGEIETETGSRWMYATDASIYRQLPAAVAYPRDEHDVRLLVLYARDRGLGLIPRGAGTSLAGQCVGEGVVVDMTRHMNRILHIDVGAGRAVVEPGVVRDELNRALEDTEWIFGPNTSTSNRATIGGMVGNNSSGTTSLAYGVTRDKILRLRTVFANGDVCDIAPYSIEESGGHPMLDQMDQWLKMRYKDDAVRQAIYASYPHPDVHRRCTGYAIDTMLRNYDHGVIDWTAVICGSEGTLGICTEIELQLDRRMPSPAILVAIAYDDLDTSLRHVPLLLNHVSPYALELMDDHIWNCVADHPMYKRYQRHLTCRSPKAILMMELCADDPAKLIEVAEAATAILPEGSYQCIDHCMDDAIEELWAMRKAGLGLLTNLDGAGAAVACIEDTAVHPSRLADYIHEVDAMMRGYGQEAVYYAHAGAGELHIRPVLDLSTEQGRIDLESICKASADLVKKYRGALSGEHGDGRVRGPYLEDFFGSEVYGHLVSLKQLVDPAGVFNPGKIIAAPSLLEDVKVDLGGPTYDHGTWRAISERCTGSGDCLKSSALSPGMCPTYQAMPREELSTRGRAHLLQYAALHPAHDQEVVSRSIKSCLSCKACQTECPSSVDMAWIKSQFLADQSSPRSWRDHLISRSASYSQGVTAPWIYKLASLKILRPLYSWMGLHHSVTKSLPTRALFMAHGGCTQVEEPTLILIVDEFVNAFQPEVASAALTILEHLGHRVQCVQGDSMRAAISKGALNYARGRLLDQLDRLSDSKASVPLIMIEPSAYSVFVDEILHFLPMDFHERYHAIRRRLLPIGQFLAQHTKRLEPMRPPRSTLVRYHAHCHARANDTDVYWIEVLQAMGAEVNTTKRGCCGMAGSYGYELEHYHMSKAVFDLGLGDDISHTNDSPVLATGMSCRHQVERFNSQVTVMHPLEWMATLVSQREDDYRIK